MSKARKHTSQKVETSAPDYTGREGVVYVRVSAKSQEINGSGRTSQAHRCVGRLNSLGIPHLKTFYDTYTGGGDFMNRPAMREFLAYADAHPHKELVVAFDDLKRFARDTQFHIKLRSALKARNIIP